MFSLKTFAVSLRVENCWHLLKNIGGTPGRMMDRYMPLRLKEPAVLL